MRRVKRGVQNTGFRMQISECGTTTPNCAPRTPNSSGFTLIEIVITIVLVTILSGLAAVIALQAVKAYSTEQSRSDVHYQSRAAMERMAREIRLMRWNTALAQADVTIMSPTIIRYTDIQGNQMGFRLNVAEVQRTQDNAATWQTLATGVTALTFNYFQQDGVTPAAAATLWFVEIMMTDTQGSETVQMRTRVHPRNF